MKMANLEIAESVHKQAKSLADRWVLAWGDYSHRGGACGVELDFHSKVIRFRPSIVDGFVYNQIQIPFAYFEDSSTLEADSKASRLKESEEKEKIFNRIRELENSPEVKELNKLNSRLGKPIFSYGGFKSTIFG